MINSNYMLNKATILTLAIVVLSCYSFNKNEKYKVFDSSTDSLQIRYMLQRLNDQFEKRREAVEESLSSKEALLKRQNQLKKWYKNIVGKLPERNDLNTIVTKEKEFEDYKIQWVAFESQPDHHVTGMLYLPKKGNVPYPAVYIPCGHNVNGKGSEMYQKAARLFVTNGFVVLQGDPVCQGERMQYLNDEGKPATVGRMLMHEILGQKLMLTGSNTLIHELWDNVRCLDFLEQHPLVDKNKLAVAGNSGGGTQTTYLVAFDERVKVATPSCYIATTEKKFNTIGSQDGCQQVWGEGKVGAEEQDFLFMAAPKPIRILSAEQDFFNKEGAIAAYKELKRVYGVLGVPEKIDQIFCNEKHGWHKPLREASVQWCKKWLLNDDSPVSEPEDIGCYIELDDIWVTNTGQVLTYFENERSVSDIIRERLTDCEVSREKFLNNHSKGEIIAKVKELIGYEEVLNNPMFEKIDELSEEGFTVEKYLIQRESGKDFKLPCLLIKSKEQVTHSISVVFSEFGKESLFENGIIEREIKEGKTVLALDVSNTGELKNKSESKYDNKEFWVGKLPLYEGKTLLAYRTEDIIIGLNFIKGILNDISDIKLISQGFTGPAAIHAAVINGDVSEVALNNAIKSWDEMAASEYSSDQIGNIVPNVLNYYDLNDLVELVKEKVRVN